MNKRYKLWLFDSSNIRHLEFPYLGWNDLQFIIY